MSAEVDEVSGSSPYDGASCETCEAPEGDAMAADETVVDTFLARLEVAESGAAR